MDVSGSSNNGLCCKGRQLELRVTARLEEAVISLSRCAHITQSQEDPLMLIKVNVQSNDRQRSQVVRLVQGQAWKSAKQDQFWEDCSLVMVYLWHSSGKGNGPEFKYISGPSMKKVHE